MVSRASPKNRTTPVEDSGHATPPQDLATEAITTLEAIVGDLREIAALIEQEVGVEAEGIW